jgi:3D (Asp-Asp-Asp) domain-containing protein
MRGGGMFTRSVISFSGKSVIVSAILPGMLLIAPAAAFPTASKNEIKTTDARHDASPRQIITTRKKKTPREVAMQSRGSTGSSLSTQQQAPTKTQAAKALSLGAFTLRAYTQYAPAHQAPNKTATGTIPRSGRTVAVDPRVIPYGTKIYIEGLGERIAEDSGASIKGRQLDVFLPTVEHCRNFGVQTRAVKIMLE